ncbi:hypothetical protein [Streptomyces cinnamoneus]|uniref:hypothetical protein n=1 Tax=Streptomyces cinnamoneus TaxID=53446 RepID=UPI000CEE024D|nr:hypothetical protein [Streptomyces cinnamoneus]PPT14823.1 hypothetical protein CYQ11_19860 [Streptomyces cinnamoneus]
MMKTLRKLNPWANRRAEREAWARTFTYASETIHKLDHEVAVLRSAVDEFADVFNDGMLASMVGGKFTCGEADSLVRFFARVGRQEVAELWLECHAEDDDEGDLHKTFDDEDTPDGTVVDLGEYLLELAA